MSMLTELNGHRDEVSEEQAIDAVARELYAWLACWELPAPDDVPDVAARLVTQMGKGER